IGSDYSLAVVNVGESTALGMDGVTGGTTYFVEYTSSADTTVQNVIATDVGASESTGPAYLHIHTPDTEREGIETLNLDVSNTVRLQLEDAAENMEVFNITGSGPTQLSGETDFPNLVSLNSTGYTGDLTLDVTGSDDLESVLTGGGDDFITVKSSALDGVVVIDLNGGAADTLGVDNDGSTFNTADVEDLDFSTISGVEILSLLDDVDLNADLLWDLSGLPELTTLAFTDFLGGSENVRLEGVSDLTITSEDDFKAGNSGSGDDHLSGSFRDLTIETQDDAQVYFYDKDENDTDGDQRVANLRDFSVVAGGGADPRVDVGFYNDDENDAYESLRSVSITAEAGTDPTN
ncbi:MAG: hypothetical protein LC687_03900, partial [Actinobacteria bacterium]|nr:hypothetical protein [Actinomycetota bacterium]